MNDSGSREFDIFIGSRLREERRLAGFSREELGEALGLSAGTIDGYESGERRLPARRFAEIAAALGAPMSAFFRNRTRAKAVAGDAPNHPRWVNAERSAKLLCRQDFAQVAPLVEAWKRSRGALTEDIENALLVNEILHRIIMVRRPPASSHLVVEHFGKHIVLARPSDMLGRDIQDRPDRTFSELMREAFETVLRRRDPIIEACRAIVQTWNGKTINVRYDRVLLPWRWRGADEFAMSISLRRGNLTEMRSTTATIAP